MGAAETPPFAMMVFEFCFFASNGNGRIYLGVDSLSIVFSTIIFFVDHSQGHPTALLGCSRRGGARAETSSPQKDENDSDKYYYFFGGGPPMGGCIFGPPEKPQ